MRLSRPRYGARWLARSHQPGHEHLERSDLREESKFSHVAYGGVEHLVHERAEANGAVHRKHVHESRVEFYGAEPDVIVGDLRRSVSDMIG